MVQLGRFFADEKITDIGFRVKFISIYHELLNTKPEAALLIFHMIERALTLDLATTNSMETVESISKIIFKVSEIKGYEPERYINSIDEMLKARKITYLKKMDDLQPVE